MYDIGGAASAALWQGLRRHLVAAGLRDVPENLSIPGDYTAHWLDQRLLLSQTCGYPLTHALSGRVRYVGTPSYEAPGTMGSLYSSAVMVRIDDLATDIAGLRGRRAAYNGRDSQSGYNALRDLVAPYAETGRFFAAVIETGSHIASLAALRTEQADVAAIDAVTLALAPEAAKSGLRVLQWSRPVPGLPYVTSLATSESDLQRLRHGIAAALADPALEDARRALRLTGFDVLDETAYAPLIDMERRAVSLGYPGLN